MIHKKSFKIYFTLTFFQFILIDLVGHKSAIIGDVLKVLFFKLLLRNSLEIKENKKLYKICLLNLFFCLQL